MKLTPEEKAFIKNNETMIDGVLRHLDAVRVFKEDDYLIAFHPASTYSSRRQATNSYGAPKKYKVITVDKHGVPYIKELNKAGKPVGQLICPIKYESSSNRFSSNIGLEFEVDPDYADAIILEDTDGFQAAAVHKLKADTFKEITEFNKNNKINTHEYSDLANFINSLNIGDTLWRSNQTSWTVTSISPVPRDKANRIQNEIYFMEVQTNKGKILKLSFWDIKGKALYKNRPRTYRELRDLI